MELNMKFEKVESARVHMSMGIDNFIKLNDIVFTAYQQYSKLDPEIIGMGKEEVKRMYEEIDEVFQVLHTGTVRKK